MVNARIEPKSLEMQVNGLRLHYLDWGGEGLPPLVLLHGYSAQAHFWDGFSAKMSGDYHVYALDQRGHGDSDWSDSYPPEAMPSDLAAFVDQLGLQTFTLAGHSMGGGVAFRYAAQHPERIERLIIVDSSLPHPERPPAANRDNSVTRSLAVESYDTEDAAIDHFQSMQPNVPRERIRQAVHQAFRQGQDGRWTYKFDPKLRTRNTGSPEQVEQHRRDAEAIRRDIQRLSVPALLVRGGNSDILSPEGAEETAAAVPNMTVVTVPNTGHNVPTDDARGFRHAVRSWLGLPCN